MAATFEYDEDNGAATGSPAKGATRAHGVTNVDWKNVDDIATPYSESPIIIGTNSFTKYQFGHFSGTFNEISNGLWAHVQGDLEAGVTLKGKVTSDYETPSVAANAALDVDMSPVIAIDSGQEVLFSPTGPEDQAPAVNLTEEGYTQYLASQLQTADGAGTGDITPVVLRLQYNEN